MEPVLELATRITSHIWFLHHLRPEEAHLEEIGDADWRAAAQPTSYSAFQNLLDLVDLHRRGVVWRSDEWLWPWGPPPPEPPPAPPPAAGAPQPSGFLQLLQNRARALRDRIVGLRHAPARISRWLQEGRRRALLRGLRESWQPLRQRQDEALNAFVERTRLLRTHRLLAIPMDENLTRERLYELVASRLLQKRVRDRVEIARGFVNGREFFIEEHLSDCARRSRRYRVGSSRGPVAVDLALGGDPGAEADQAARRWLREWGREAKLACLLDFAELRSLCLRLGAAVPFSMVQRDELDEIARLRRARFGERPSENPVRPVEDRTRAYVGHPYRVVQKQAGESCLFGLALSGGGIRSATFALGLLQGMADRSILPYIDVLSTVSGGGYIGSWLIAWIKRKGGVRPVQESLRGNATPLVCSPPQAPAKGVPKPDPFRQVPRNVDPDTDHVRPIRILREYARYLAPQAGLFSADTWTIATTWMRNTFLNLLILVASLGALLLLPRLAAFVLIHRHFVDAGPWPMFVVSYLLFMAACFRIGMFNLATFGPYWNQGGNCTRGDGDVKVALWVLLPVFLGAYFLVAFLWYGRAHDLPWVEVVAACTLLVGSGLIVLWRTGRDWQPSQLASKRGGFGWPYACIAVIGAMLVAAGLALGLYQLTDTLWQNTERNVWMAASLGVVFVCGMIVLTTVVFIGLMGISLSDEQREWWGRMAALLGIAVVTWLLFCSISYAAPYGIIRLGIAASAAGGVWALITGWGSKLAFSAKSGKGGENGGQGLVNSTVLALAPTVFVLGILLLVSFGLFLAVGGIVHKLGDQGWYQANFAYDRVSRELCCGNTPLSMQGMLHHYWSLMYGGSVVPYIVLLLLAGVALFFARGVDINQFSMHNFYKNRLVRCYMGASRVRAHREPNAFTGFDLEDDIRLSRFQSSDWSQPPDMSVDCAPSYVGPFPILNTALNVTQGADLALQQRKAESFFFTPLWSGFDYTRRQAAIAKTALGQYGFRQTWEFATPENLGVRLGTAMAISGAAFNSNMGFHTSPSLAFLLTVFGVRLGWWAGNPRTSRWIDPSPSLGLGCLARELTANTNTDSDFLLLSDGGHFENMGLYELIRRRCRFIIVSDAEEDEDFKLEGIGGAIRKCRVDFGVGIDLNVDALQPVGDPKCSRLHYSVGNIRYPGEEECGKLIYIKSSVTGDEPVDVLEFRKSHPEFPHTSTMDQFFDESHFESYRALGQHVAQDVFLRDMDTKPAEGLAGLCSAVRRLFDGVEKDWKARVAALSTKDKSSAKDS